MCKLQQGGADAVGGGSIDVTKGRVILPANVKATNYDLTLEPDFDKFSFEGTVIIE
jgi:aminopeptidase 2